MPAAEEELQPRCRECQARLTQDTERAKKFSAENPNCICDTVSISQHSPGKIDDDELLVRFVIEPKQLAADGTIEVTALRDIHENGLSLARRKYLADEDLARRGRQLVALAQKREIEAAEKQQREPTSRSLLGFVQFKTGAVRRHTVDGLRRFCVMDSADANDPYHADIT